MGPMNRTRGHQKRPFGQRRMVAGASRAPAWPRNVSCVTIAIRQEGIAEDKEFDTG
jgi:hypothetical protein